MPTPAPPLPAFLVTGHAALDEQHAGILAQVERLRGLDPAEVAVACSFLEQHARAHFAHEELLMAESGYAEAPAHRAEHQELAAAIARWRSILEQQGAPAVLRAGMLAALERWIAEHILQADRLLVRHLRSRAARSGGSGAG